MFLDQDERLLLFHYRLTPFELSLESLKGFRKAGIKTSMLDSTWASWHEVEPSPGAYNWDVVDKVIDKQREAGFKTILMLYHRAPDWVKGCVDVTRHAGTVNLAPEMIFPGTSYRAIDPFCLKAMYLESEYIQRACERYSSPDVLCCYAIAYGGERILPYYLNRSYSKQNIISVVMARQSVFAKYNKELWTMFHPAFATAAQGSVDRSTHPHVGNEYLWACYDVMRETYPDHVLHQFISQFFSIGPCRCIIEGAKVWVGAEYAHGVVGNAKKLPAYGIWGMVMGAVPGGWPQTSGQPEPAAYVEVEKALEILGAQS